MLCRVYTIYCFADGMNILRFFIFVEISVRICHSNNILSIQTFQRKKNARDGIILLMVVFFMQSENMDIIQRFWQGVHSLAVLEVVQTLVLSELCFLCSQRRAYGVQRPFVVVILQMLYCNSSTTKGCSTTTSSIVI